MRHTLQIGDLWSADAPSSSGDDVRSAYLPFVSTRSVFVVAIDLSRAEIRGQAAGEARTVRVATDQRRSGVSPFTVPSR